MLVARAMPLQVFTADTFAKAQSLALLALRLHCTGNNGRNYLVKSREVITGNQGLNLLQFKRKIKAKNRQFLRAKTALFER